jgi:hypothetical protein
MDGVLMGRLMIMVILGIVVLKETHQMQKVGDWVSGEEF